MLAKLARKKRDYWIKLSFVGLGVLGHQLLVLLPQGVHPINHLLHKLDLAKRGCFCKEHKQERLLTSEYPSLCLFEMS